MANIKKNAKGYGYTYTDLAHVNSYIEELGETYYQYVETTDGVDYIVTVREKDGKEKQVRGCRVIQATLSGKNNPAQEQGSGLTYARRYSLLMAYGLATTDDDGEIFTDNEPKPTKIGKIEVKILETIMANKGIDVEACLSYWGVKNLAEVNTKQYAEFMKRNGGK